MVLSFFLVRLHCLQNLLQKLSTNVRVSLESSLLESKSWLKFKYYLNSFKGECDWAKYREDHNDFESHGRSRKREKQDACMGVIWSEFGCSRNIFVYADLIEFLWLCTIFVYYTVSILYNGKKRSMNHESLGDIAISCSADNKKLTRLIRIIVTQQALRKK